MSDKFSEDFGLFIELGFIAIKQGDEDAAQKLFSAAQTLRPDHSAPLLGMGQIALNKLELTRAGDYFKTVLAKEPNNAMAKVLLGFCFLLPKLGVKRRKGVPTSPEELSVLAEGGKRLIVDGMKGTQDPGIQVLGKSALDLMEKVQKYQDTPLKK